MIKIKRIYEEPSDLDGYRIFVDRLWARGVKKEDAAIDLWLKEITPSPELRKWYSHDLEKFEAFGKSYREELDKNPAPVEQVLALEEEHGAITLLYAARDKEHSHALVLQDYLRSQQSS